jgi:hypothetical protein
MNRVQRLKDEISRLKKEQIAAQASGALNGMTIEESRQYKERHFQIKTLAIEIAALSCRPDAQSREDPHEHERAKKIAG